jgi:uncharacterized SAM-binding protein YcdF (DUF218 family)
MKRFSKNIIFTVVLIFLVAAAILFYSPNFIKHDDVLEKADAIVVLGGEAGERVHEGVQLYNNGYAQHLILTGGLLAWQTNSADIMKKQALAAGVPERAIITESSAESTRGNAVLIMPILKKLKANKIIVVTSAYHSKRAKMIFDHCLKPLGIKVIIRSVIPNQYTRYSPSFWWTRHEDRQFVLSELFKYVYYRIMLLRP